MRLNPLFLATAALVGSGLAAPETSGSNYPVQDFTVPNNGTAAGETKDIYGVQTYISKPHGRGNGQALLYIVDAYGLPLIQNKLLADSFAKAGYFVVAPDVFRGDPAPNDLAAPGFNFTTWLAGHPVDDVEKVLDGALKYIRDDVGIKTISATGYCFGGRFVLRYLKKGRGIAAGYAAHPSLVTDEDLKGVAGPIGIGAAETDTLYTPELRKESEELWRNASLTYQINLYSGVEHGFGVRVVNASDPRQQYAKDEAYLQAVRWFKSWA